MMEDVEAIVRAIVKAWEALPGGRNYDMRVVERWLVEDMKPEIDKARTYLLSQPKE